MTVPRPYRLAVGAAVLAVAAVAASCGSGGNGSPAPGPRRLMLREVSAIVIVPTYERLVNEAESLVNAAAQLDDAPDAASLAATQTAWRQTRAVWKQSEAFAIGPAQTLRTAAKIDWSPIKGDRIEAEIAGTAELTGTYVEDLGANVKGFLAIEYLLFDSAGDDAATVQALGGDARRRRFVRALAENLRDQAALLRDAWTGGFAAVFGNPGSDNPQFPTVKGAVDLLVNQLIFLSEEIADAQLLAALGTRNGGAPNPAALAAHRSQNGLADLLDDLAGLQSLYFGAYAGRRGASLNDIVGDLSGDVRGALSLAIVRSVETASRIPQPLERAVTADQALVERAQIRAKELMRRLEIDLVSVLGTTLRFNPNDGD